MNDLTTWNGSLELADLEPEKRLCIDGFNRAIDMAEISFHEAGRCLCELKKSCKHGEFEALAAKHCNRLGKTQRVRAMKVYEEYGQTQMLHRCNFSNSVLSILAYAPDPQAALEDAQSRTEAGEEITKQAAREIAAAQKAQREAEARAERAESERDAVQLRLDQATTPDQSRLIPELVRTRKAGGITEAEANDLSLLPEHLQRLNYERIRRGEALIQERDAAERTAAQAVQQQQRSMAEARQAKAEAEEARRRADELARDGVQSVIDDLNAQIETLNKQIARERETAWEEGKKAGIAQKDEAQAKNAADLMERLAQLEKDKAAVQRKLTSAEGAIQSMGRERRMLEAELNGAKEQLESAHPLAKDNIHAGVINHMTEDLRATLAKLEADCEPHQRKLSEEALQALFELVDGYLEKQHATLIEGATYEG